MSKSNATEIIALLYAILATQVTTPWLHWIFVAMAIENVLESMYNSYKEHTS